MRRAIVTGASGLLGAAVLGELAARLDAVEGWSHVVEALPDGTPLRRVDLAAPGVPEAALRAARPDLVVHCAALTDVDGCEAEPGAAYALNAEAPRRLAVAARDLGARFVHISTDAVYDGELPGTHAESEPPAPANAYARTKLEGERGVLAAHPGALVVRTTMHGWTALGRRSFSEAILRGLLRGEPLTLFADVRFSPLVVTDLAALIHALADRGTAGVLNVGAADAVTKEAFGHFVAAAFELPADAIAGISLADLGLAARRPRNTALAVERLTAALGTPPPTVAEGVRRFHAEAAAGIAARLKGRDGAAPRALVEDPAG